MKRYYKAFCVFACWFGVQAKDSVVIQSEIVGMAALITPAEQALLHEYCTVACTRSHAIIDIQDAVGVYYDDATRMIESVAATRRNPSRPYPYSLESDVLCDHIRDIAQKYQRFVEINSQYVEILDKATAYAQRSESFNNLFEYIRTNVRICMMNRAGILFISQGKRYVKAHATLDSMGKLFLAWSRSKRGCLLDIVSIPLSATALQSFVYCDHEYELCIKSLHDLSRSVYASADAVYVALESARAEFYYAVAVLLQ